MDLTAREELLIRRCWELEAAILDAIGGGDIHSLDNIVEDESTRVSDLPPMPLNYFYRTVATEPLPQGFMQEEDLRTEAYIAGLEARKQLRLKFERLAELHFIRSARALGLTLRHNGAKEAARDAAHHLLWPTEYE